METKSGFAERTIDQLAIADEAAFRHIELARELTEVLRRSAYTFRILPEAGASWDRALFLNLTFWSPQGGGDVLVEEEVPVDVVAHVAWHHLASRALAVADEAPGAEALLLGESIASAFDLYLVGRMLGRAEGSSFLESQVPRMADAAASAGLSDEDFEALLEGVAEDPERAFEDLRELLFDASTACAACSSADDALRTLQRFETHRFAALLHHYELSNWVLYTRAYASSSVASRERALALDAALRAAPVALDWLAEQWVRSTGSKRA